MEPGPSKTTVERPKSVKTFKEFQAAKGTEWKRKVTGKKKEAKKGKEFDVLLYIGLLEWKDKQNALKPLRGKKLALRIPNTTTYSLLRSKAEEKWKSFHSNLYDDAQSYELLYEDGQKALFLPGSNELFMLNRYQEELGKDYNRITLYLCTSQDYNRAIDCAEGSDSDDLGFEVTKDMKLEKPPVKRTRVDVVLDSEQGISDCLLVGDHSSDSPGDSSVLLQIQQDEQLAKELQNQVDQKELLPAIFKRL